MKFCIKRIELSNDGFLQAVEFEAAHLASADEVAEYVQELRHSIVMKEYNYKVEAVSE